MASIAAERIAVTPPLVITPQNPGLMSYPWKVISTSVNGVAREDILRLRTNGTIELQGSHSAKSTLWATSCMLTCAGLSGVTVDNRQFLIKLDAATGKLTCTFPAPAQSQAAQTLGHKPGPDGTWVAEEGGPNTMPPDSRDSGPSKG